VAERAGRNWITALQTLFAQYTRQSLDVVHSNQVRAERLKWAAQNVGRTISSFNELSVPEARSLVELLKTSLGQEETRPPKRRLHREAARAAGTQGRRGVVVDPDLPPTDADLARIQDAVARLGWDQARFDAFLRSPASPLQQSNPQVRTAADANRVWYALKNMLIRAGKWKRSERAQG